MTIAEQLANATTPGQKAAVTKKINALVLQAGKEGKNVTQVRAGFKAAATRLRLKTENSGTTLSAELSNAISNTERAAVRRKIRRIVAKAVKNGKNPTMVLAGIKAAAVRYYKENEHPDILLTMRSEGEKVTAKVLFGWLR